MDHVIIIILVQGIICGGFCSFIASEKQRDPVDWFVLGFFFSILAVLALVAIPKLESKVSDKGQAYCPFCKEVIKPDAVICKHCRSSLSSNRPIVDNNENKILINSSPGEGVDDEKKNLTPIDEAKTTPMNIKRKKVKYAIIGISILIVAIGLITVIVKKVQQIEEEQRLAEIRDRVLEKARQAEEARKAEEGRRGSVTDIDGNVYQTVKIGNQWWMAENLKTTRYRNGIRIPNITDAMQWYHQRTGAFSIYDNDSSNDKTYGKLYNGFAVTDSRGLCPEGWRVPSDDDWQILVNLLGGERVAGGKMKSITGWRYPNTGATNESGFTALPSGYVHGVGFFLDIRNSSGWWSSTESGLGTLWIREVSYINSDVKKILRFRTGFPVRCIKE